MLKYLIFAVPDINSFRFWRKIHAFPTRLRLEEYLGQEEDTDQKYTDNILWFGRRLPLLGFNKKLQTH